MNKQVEIYINVLDSSQFCSVVKGTKCLNDFVLYTIPPYNYMCASSVIK